MCRSNTKHEPEDALRTYVQYSPAGRHPLALAKDRMRDDDGRHTHERRIDQRHHQSTV